MSYVHIEEERGGDGRGVAVPRGALLMAAALIALTIGLAAVARNTQRPAPVASAAPVVSRALVFTDREDGSVDVYDVRRREALAPLPVGGGGFVRGALRALARQRRLAGVGTDVPFYLARWPDGRFTLDDSATRNRLDLHAYGPTNTEAFAVLLPSVP